MLNSFLRILLASTLCISSAWAQSLTTTAHVKLKKRPTANSHVVSLLDKGARLETLSTDSIRNGYVWVSDGVDSGWVFKRYTKNATGLGSNVPFLISSVTTPAALATCPLEGESSNGGPTKPADAASNRRKRNLLPLGPAQTLTFADFKILQRDVEQLFQIDAHAQTLTLQESDRMRLKSLPLSHGTASEGDLVQVIGYIVAPDPHPNTGETVNCNHTEAENNDFHITLGPSVSKNSGFQGIVVEMIPQNRIAEWSIQNLLRVEADKRPVLVVGQLFYDMKHKVNDDPAHKKTGQPVRASLFEVHPISEMYVCAQGKTCTIESTANWLKLKDY